MKKILILNLMLLSVWAYSQDPQISWGHRYGGTSFDRAEAITTDPSGNVITVGTFIGTIDFDPGPSSLLLNSGGGQGGSIQKLDAAGELQWVNVLREVSSGAGCFPTSVVTDASGNVYVTGYFAGSVDFDPGAGTNILTASSNLDGFIMRFSAFGSFAWVRQIESGGDVRIQGITLDETGELFVTGRYTGVIDFDPGVGTSTRATAGQDDIFIIKISTFGTYRWGYGAGGTGDEEANDIAIDSNGDVYLACKFLGSTLNETIFVFAPAGTIARLTGFGQSDIAIFKIDGSNGGLVWGLQAGGSSSDVATTVGVSPSDEVYLGGSFSGTADLNPHPFQTANVTSAGSTDAFLLKLTTAGIRTWVHTIGGSSGEVLGDLDVSSTGNIHMAGTFNGTVDFDPSSGTANLTSTGTDGYVSILSEDGNHVWAGLFDTSIDIVPNGIAANGNNIYSTGYFRQVLDVDPTASTLNLASASADFDMYHFKLSTNNDPTNIALSNSTIAENNSINATVGTLTTTDADAGDSHSYALVSGSGDTDNSSFSINTNQLRIGISTNHEVKSTYSVRIQTSDGNGGVYSKSFTITVSDQPESPTDITLTPDDIDENTAGAVGSISVVDEDDGDSHNLFLVPGAGDTHNGIFTLTGSNLSLNKATSHESNSTLSVRLRAVDGNSNVFEKAVTITINDVPEDPTNVILSNTNIAENLPSGTTIGTLSSTDQDDGDTHTYTLVAGSGSTDNTSFTIAGNKFRSNTVFDFETKNSYSVRIQTRDSNGGTFERVYTINVTDVSEDPDDLALDNNSIEENNAINAVIGNLSTTDQDVGETYTYSLVSGTGDADNTAFNINGNQLRASSSFDFETKTSYTVRIQTNDGNSGTFAKALNITVTNEPEAPTDLSLSNNTIPENNPLFMVIGNLSTTDQDAGETYTYTFVSGAGDTDNTAFNINGNQLRAASNFNFEVKNTYSVLIETNDGNSGTFAKAFTITITDRSESPDDLLLDNSSIEENNAVNAVIGNFSTIDEDAGETYTYSLVSGTGDTDNTAFNINGNQLRASSSFDFETKTSYTVRMQTDDGNSGTFIRIFSITVTDANDAPNDLFLSNSSVLENVPTGTVVGTLTTADQDAGDTHSYSFKPGTPDNDFFTIDGDQLLAAAIFDFETKSTYNLEIFTNDGNGGQFEQEFAVTVADAPEAPFDVTLSDATIFENEGMNAVVGVFIIADPDNSDTHTVEFATGDGDTDNNLFLVESDVVLRAKNSFDFEAQSSYSIRVKATDSGDLTFEKSLTITVLNVNETPTDIALSSTSIQENNITNAVIGTLSAVDDDDTGTYTYSLVTGAGDTDNSFFNINGNELRASSSFDFETRSSYSIRLQTNDFGGGSFAKAIVINVINESEAPTDIDLDNNSIQESLAIGTVVGNLSTTDPDNGETYLYTLVSGSGDTDNASFSIVDDELRSAVVFDFETKTSYSVRIQTDDGNGNLYAEAFTINIEDVPPMITDIGLTNTEVDENLPVGTLVGTFSTVGEEVTGTYTYSFVIGQNANSLFNIVNDDQLVTAAIFDHEMDDSYGIQVMTDDGNGNTFEKIIFIDVNDVSEAPTDIALSNSSVAENMPIGTLVGSFSSIDEDLGETHSYSFVAGDGSGDNTFFSISGNELATAVISHNFEIQTEFTIRVQSDDGNGGTYEKTFIITIEDVPEAPTNFSLSANSINENNAVNAVVGTLNTEDEDGGETHTYSLVSGSGDTDNASFNINGNELRASESFDFETKNVYNIRIQTNDGNGGTFSKNITLAIDDVNEVPIDVQLSNSSIEESNPQGTVIGTLSTIDEDAGQSHTYSIVAGSGDTDNSSFIISGSDLLSAEVFDFETKSSYSIRVRTDDGDGGTFEKVFAITIDDLPKSITSFDVSNNTINENEVVGSLVGTFSTSGEDLSGNFTYALISGTGDTDNSSFSILGDQLLTAESFDFETQNSFSILVMTDDGDESDEKIFTIMVDDVSESPTNIMLSANTINENNPANATIGTLSTTDEDDGETYTYSLVSGTGDTDNSSFSISGDQLRAIGAFDFETQATYSVRIETNDGNGGTHQQEFTININDQNDVPTDLSLDNATIDENSQATSLVGVFSTIDMDTGDTHSYTLVAGIGDTDNASFAIAGNELQSAAVFDFETQESYNVRVQTDDGNGGTFQKELTITINDVVERQEQTITFDALADKVFGDDPFVLSAIASSGLDVTFSVVSGPISITAGEVSIIGAGMAVIAANQSGDNDFFAAPEITQSFVIGKAEQVIDISAIDDAITTDEPFDVVATVDSGLDLVYEVAGPATISGATITLDGEVGEVTVTVSQAGNENYNAASSTTTFSVGVPTAIDDELYSISIYPNPATSWLKIDKADAQEVDIKMYNLEGHMVLSRQISLKQDHIDVSNLNAGVYVVQLESKLNFTTTKVLIAK